MPQINADTRLDVILTRPGVIENLAREGIIRVADLAQVTERQLLAIWGVGKDTFGLLKDALAQSGLELKPDPDPRIRELFEARDSWSRGKPLDVVTPETRLSLVGLKPALVSKLRDRKVHTVGDVAALSARDLARKVGRREGIELIALIARAGLVLEGNSGPAELWAFGFLEGEEPGIEITPKTRIAALEGVLGSSLVRALVKAGIGDVAALTGLVAEIRAGRRRVSYVGESALRKIEDVIARSGGQVATTQIAAKAPRRIPAAQGLDAVMRGLRAPRENEDA